jgi:hypothetical protein
MFHDTVKPTEAYPAIKQLMLNGGSASTIVDGNFRIIYHSRVLRRPVGKLPWPLSKLQPHAISFIVYEGNPCDASPFGMNPHPRILSRVVFQKREIDTAIKAFFRRHHT